MANRDYQNEELTTVTYLEYKTKSKIILQKYSSCSLVNADGTLLYSKDLGLDLLITTRLVAFQIVKKYLNPKPLDIFILNDPENGGFQYAKLIYIACLTPNLFLVWDENDGSIDFKIPPTPLYENGKKNEFVWQALVSTHKHSDQFKCRLELQKKQIDHILIQKQIVSDLELPKNQNIWLKASQEVFNLQFSNKTTGSIESYFKLHNNQLIKLNLKIEEKQNVRLITLDFTNTNLARDISAASHVVESALIKEIVEFYNLTEFFSQSVLDKIKTILPPRSIVSKSHPQGLNNFEIQMICKQLCHYNLIQLNNHSRKAHAQFRLNPFISFHLYNENIHSRNLLTEQYILLDNFENLIESKCIDLKKMRKQDNRCELSFSVSTRSNIEIRIDSLHQNTDEKSFLLNGQPLTEKITRLNSGDLIEIVWI